MRIRRAAFLAAISACALAAACIPDLLTDPIPDAGVTAQIGAYCGDGIITLGEYDGGFSDPKAGELCDPSEAGAIGCTRDCKIDCDGGYVDPITNHCYFQAIQASALDTAEQSCEAANGHVVSFLDDRERFGLLGSAGAPAAYWVDLSLNPELAAYTPATPNSQQEPGWLPTCSGCYAAPNVQDGGIPRLVFDAGGSCVVDIGALGWSQLPCTQIPKGVAVICEREPPGSLAVPCAGDTCVTIPQTKGRKRYLFSKLQRSATDAEQACQVDLGGSLVVFESLEERETLLRELVRVSSELPVKEAWIGLSSTSAAPDASFIWDDDAGLSASPWGDGQPSWDASAPLRAFVRLGVDNYDVQLAHVDTTQTLRPYICQY